MKLFIYETRSSSLYPGYSSSSNYVEEFIYLMDYQHFFADEKTKYAVVRSLEVIGEATKNIPRSIRQKYKNVPWKEMAQMRDKIAHAYFGIDYDIVWKVIKESLPQIIITIEQILHDVQDELIFNGTGNNS